MNRKKQNPHDSCGMKFDFDDEAIKQGFKAIEWEELDVSIPENLSLLKSYMSYKTRVISRRSDSAIQKNSLGESDQFISKNNRLWKSNFDLNNDGVIDSVYKVTSACAPDNFTLFIYSEKGLSSTDLGRQIDVRGSAFTYKGETFTTGSFVINKPSVIHDHGGNPNVFSEFITAGLDLCRFRPVSEQQGE